jgi:hypothetical protein
MVPQSRRLRRSPSRLDARRDSRSASTDLAFDSHNCHQKISKKHRTIPRQTHAEEAPLSNPFLESWKQLTHPIPMPPQRQSRLLPLLKMPRRIHRPARVPLRPYRPVLRERRRPNNRGGVDAPLAPDFVGAAVGVEGSVAGVVGVVGRVVRVAEVFDYVVFDERVRGPAVEAEVGVS